MFECQRIVVFDLEWTSWPGFMDSGWNQPGHYCEIIQIGAVSLLVEEGYREIDSFQILVRPKVNPTLSDFIVNLTGITQAKLDSHGVDFHEAFTAFLDFAGSEPIQFACFGPDKNIIEVNFELNKLPKPTEFSNCVDLQKEFLRLNIVEEDWESSDLPNHLDLPSTGKAHDALADSRAVASALRKLENKLNERA